MTTRIERRYSRATARSSRYPPYSAGRVSCIRNHHCTYCYGAAKQHIAPISTLDLGQERRQTLGGRRGSRRPKGSVRTRVTSTYESTQFSVMRVIAIQLIRARPSDQTTQSTTHITYLYRQFPGMMISDLSDRGKRHSPSPLTSLTTSPRRCNSLATPVSSCCRLSGVTTAFAVDLVARLPAEPNI